MEMPDHAALLRPREAYQNVCDTHGLALFGGSIDMVDSLVDGAIPADKYQEHDWYEDLRNVSRQIFSVIKSEVFPQLRHGYVSYDYSFRAGIYNSKTVAHNSTVYNWHKGKEQYTAALTFSGPGIIWAATEKARMGMGHPGELVIIKQPHLHRSPSASPNGYRSGVFVTLTNGNVL